MAQGALRHWVHLVYARRRQGHPAGHRPVQMPKLARSPRLDRRKRLSGPAPSPLAGGVKP